jgi:hypothetical protein
MDELKVSVPRPYRSSQPPGSAIAIDNGHHGRDAAAGLGSTALGVQLVVLKLTQYHGDFQRLLQMDTFMQVSEWAEDYTVGCTADR